MAPPPAATAGAGEGSAAAAAHDGAAAPSTSTEGSRASGGGSGSSGSGGGSTSPARAQQQVGGGGGGSGSGGGGGAAAHRSPLSGNGMAKFVVFMLLVGNLLMLSNVFQNASSFLPSQSVRRGQEFVLSSPSHPLGSSSSTAAAASTPAKEGDQAEGAQQDGKAEQAVGNGKREDRRAEEQEEEAAAAPPAAAPVPAKAAAATKKAMVAAAGPVPEDLCHFPFTDIDPDCPRFISIDWRWVNWAGLGDRFLQSIVGLTYAIHTNAFLLSIDETMAAEGVHGTYEWIPDYLKLNAANKGVTLETVQERYGNLTVIERVEDFGGVYQERVAKLREQCNVIIRVNNDDCINGRECYFAEEPRLYDVVHNVVSCWFLQTDRAALPPLIYDAAWYNVVIHLRVGDLTLFGEDKGGHAFFSTLKAQLDLVLAQTFPVHFYFFAEDPGTRSAQADYGKAQEQEKAGNSTASKAAASSNAVFGTPPRSFAFLRDIFQTPPAPIKANKAAKAAKPQRVSFVNDLDVKATIYHQMNADMVVATGSSFPFVAVTVSPKPVVLCSRSKEDGFFKAMMRADYALLNDTGLILEPTVTELRARAVVRYAEVHDRTVPYEVSIPEVERRQRRGLLRRS